MGNRYVPQSIKSVTDYNFAVHGTSNDACEDTYGGPYVASENETQAVQAFLANSPGIEVFMTFHAYGQYLIQPLGDGAPIPNQNDVVSLQVCFELVTLDSALNTLLIYLV